MKNWFEINDCASRYHDTNEARVYLCRVMENAIQAVQWQDWMNAAWLATAWVISLVLNQNGDLHVCRSTVLDQRPAAEGLGVG